MDVVRGTVAVYDTVTVVMIVDIVFVHSITVSQIVVDHKDSITQKKRQVDLLTNQKDSVCID